MLESSMFIIPIKGILCVLVDLDYWSTQDESAIVGLSLQALLVRLILLLQVVKGALHGIIFIFFGFLLILVLLGLLSVLTVPVVGIIIEFAHQVLEAAVLIFRAFRLLLLKDKVLLIMVLKILLNLLHVNISLLPHQLLLKVLLIPLPLHGLPIVRSHLRLKQCPREHLCQGGKVCLGGHFEEVAGKVLVATGRTDEADALVGGVELEVAGVGEGFAGVGGLAGEVDDVD